MTDDIYEDMLQQSEHYDTSEYPSTHPLFSEVNKKRVGKMKDEFPGKAIAEFVGLRSKMYSILLSDDDGKHTAKGIKLSYSKKRLRHQMYKDCLTNLARTSAKFNNIRSKGLQLHTVTMTKIALNPYDDKRYLMRDNTTLAYGHELISVAEIVDMD